MSCINFGNKNGYVLPDKLGREAGKMSSKTFTSTSAKSVSNSTYHEGKRVYDSSKAFVDKYQKLDSCPSVEDLSATYNALNKALGLTDRILTKEESIALADKKDSTLPKQPQGKSAIRSKNMGRKANHQLRNRGVNGGKVLIDIPKILSTIAKQKAEELKILEEKRIAEELLLQQQEETSFFEVEVEDIQDTVDTVDTIDTKDSMDNLHTVVTKDSKIPLGLGGLAIAGIIAYLVLKK